MRYLLVMSGIVLSGCIETIEEHDSPIGDLRRDCMVPVPAGVEALPAPVSIELGDASLWMWDELTRTGGTLATPAARIANLDDACAAPPVLQSEVLAFSADELAANSSRTDGRRLALVPLGGVAHDGTAYLYYDHVLRGPGVFDAESLGTGLCVLEPASAVGCERIDVAGSTILWPPGERVLNRGGLIIDEPDGPRALIAGCRQVASFEAPCTITGVKVADIRVPAAYRVYDVFNGWVDELVRASAVANVLGSFTIAPLGERFVGTELDVFENSVRLHLAPSPTGQYAPSIEAFDVLPPGSGRFVTGGREHTALRTHAHSIVVTYATDNAAAPGLHVVEFHVSGGLQ